MQIPVYQIDAFTDQIFSESPAAFCPLDTWPGDAIMQAIAAENDLLEWYFSFSMAKITMWTDG